MSIPRPSCQESWWGLLGQKGHCFPPEAVAWAPELLLLSLNTPHLSLSLSLSHSPSPPLSLSYTHLTLSFFKSIPQYTRRYIDTPLRSDVESDTAMFDIRLDCNTEVGLKKEYHCVGVDYFFVAGSGEQWRHAGCVFVCVPTLCDSGI